MTFGVHRLGRVYPCETTTFDELTIEFKNDFEIKSYCTVCPMIELCNAKSFKTTEESHRYRKIIFLYRSGVFSSRERNKVCYQHICF